MPRPFHAANTRWLTGLTALFFGLFVVSSIAETITHSTAVERFESEIYPMFTRLADDSCVSCHDEDTSSDLIFIGNARDDYRMLFDRQYLRLEGPDTILARVATTNSKRRMPKGKSQEPWSAEEIEKFRSFLEDLGRISDPRSDTDETFPAALLSPYPGPATTEIDNQFITYTQFKGKLQTIFQDNGIRDNRNLFQENVAFFGGADFVTRFNESSQPSSTFLTGVDIVGRDVAVRAYRARKGPFALHPKYPKEPGNNENPTSDYRAAIDHLYRSILFRSPTPKETQQAFELIKGVYQEHDAIGRQDYELGFKLSVEDPATGLKTERLISVPVSADPRGVHQEWINQSEGQALEGDDKYLRESTLTQPVRFVATDPGQRILIHRRETGTSVSLAAVKIRLETGKFESVIGVTDSSVARDGAWKIQSKNGFASYEHESVAVGQGTIQIPVRVPADGDYEVTLIWRKNAELAAAVLVEVFSGSSTQLAMPAVPEIPQKGYAQFSYDSSEDARPYANLPAQFRFDQDAYVQVSNAGTKRRVTIGALDFISAQDGNEITVDSKEAEGHEEWKEFKSSSFRAYNRKGTQLEDENKNKGQRSLKFRPPSNDENWDKDRLYGVHIHYPGKRDHETQVPVTVKAAVSSPIVQLVHPPSAKTDAAFTIDASTSYTVQRDPLRFHWEQTKGVPVTFVSTGEIMSCRVPRRPVVEAAWVAFARALIRHPDFLFARPPSLFASKDPMEKKQLQLVKIALDLVGRPPEATELETLNSGADLAELVDDYLSGQEFRDFYFHRIRLYLESQGTPIQDEPARLWSYVAFNDLPFEQILTADYSVSPAFEKQSRPEYHGRTGVLTTPGFIAGKPGLPHYNYAAQVSMLFLGYVYEVTPEIEAERDSITTALGTTDPNSTCYSCHKILTPLAFQRSLWTDDGIYQTEEKDGTPIDACDRGWVKEYPFKGIGMEAFATQAVKKERFIRTIINTHFNFYFGRSMRHLTDERDLYKRLWDNVHESDFKIRELIRAIVLSPEYLSMPADFADSRRD